MPRFWGIDAAFGYVVIGAAFIALKVVNCLFADVYAWTTLARRLCCTRILTYHLFQQIASTCCAADYNLVHEGHRAHEFQDSIGFARILLVDHLGENRSHCEAGQLACLLVYMTDYAVCEWRHFIQLL